MNLTPPQSTTPSFAKSAIPLSLTLKPSRIYVSSMLVLHGLAIAAVCIAFIPWPVKTVLVTAIVAGLCINGYEALKSRQIIWRAGNRWFIDTEKNQSSAAKLTAINFLSRWLVIISLKEENQRAKKYIIPFDATNADSYRLFRVRLRIEGHELINPPDEP